MGSHNVCTHWLYQYYVFYLAWWWLNEPKHVAEFLILIANICCVFDWINYYIIAKHNGKAPIKHNPNIYRLWSSRFSLMTGGH